MNIHVINRDTGNMTVYTQKELAMQARALAKPYGRLVAYWVNFRERQGTAQLVAQWQERPVNGVSSCWGGTETMAL